MEAFHDARLNWTQHVGSFSEADFGKIVPLFENHVGLSTGAGQPVLGFSTLPLSTPNDQFILLD
jgi:hypothetical protein